MSDTRTLLERGVGAVEPAPDALRDVLARVDRRHRRRRATAGGLGVALTVGVGVGLWTGLPGSGGQPLGIPGASCSDDTVEIYVPSGAMAPTLQVGDHILVDVHAYDDQAPARGDIVFFPLGPGHAVKRVVGLPGEEIDIRKGIPHVDGEPLEEPYLDGNQDRQSFPPERVREGHLFVLGDDRLNSNDSRHAMGQVPIDSILGQVCAVLAPSEQGSVLVPEAPAASEGS